MPTGEPIQRLSDSHYPILDLVLRGASLSTIAENTGYGITFINTIVQSPVFQNELALRRAQIEAQIVDSSVSADLEIREILQNGARQAAQRLVGLLTDPGTDAQTVRLTCADILDRTGFPKTSRLQSAPPSEPPRISPESLAALNSLFSQQTKIPGEDEGKDTRTPLSTEKTPSSSFPSPAAPSNGQTTAREGLRDPDA